MLKNCVAKVLKLFQRQPKFGETLICLIYSLVKSINKCSTTSRLLQDCNPMLPTKIFLLTSMILVTFQAKMLHAFGLAILCFAICSKDKNHYAFGHAFGQVILCLAMLLLTQYAPKTRM